MTLSQKKVFSMFCQQILELIIIELDQYFPVCVGKGHKRNENKTFDKIDKGMKRFL